MIYKSQHNQGASVILGYSIMLGIGVVMIGILLSGFGSQLEQQERNAVSSELEIAAGQIVTEFEKADATVRNSNTTSNLTVRPNFTDRAGDPTFKIELDPTAVADVYVLRIEAQNITIEKPFRSQTPVDTSSSADSTRLRIQYDQSDGELGLVNKGSNQIISTTTAIDVNGDYVIPDNSEEEPSVNATGSITGGNSSTVHGHLSAEDSIDTDSGLEVYEYVNASNSIDMGDNTYVQDNVESNGNITIGEDSALGSDVISDSGAVQIGRDTEVSSNIEASGDVNIGQNSEILNRVTSEGVVTLENESVVLGEVIVNDSSDIVCGNNTRINGMDCSTYKNNY